MSVRIIIGDAREQLKLLPDESVHCCVTSPPYFGLRDYGVAGQIGLEHTPELFVDEMVALFREVRRVLRDDGTLWLNLGDSYAGSGRGGNPAADSSTLQGSLGSQEASKVKRGRDEIGATACHASVTQHGSRVPCGLHEEARLAGNIGRAWVPPPAGLKQKDLIGAPWMVAFALRADGWYLRQDIIWAKPNPMPESVQDRCTKAHEYIFLLSKSGRYFYDADAVAERLATDPKENYPARAKVTGRGDQGAAEARGNDRDKSGGFPPRASGNKSHKGTAAHKAGAEEHRTKSGLLKISDVAYPTRNKRSVWTVATSPFSEAHFATFPTALIEPCILAGCPVGGTVLDPFGGAGTTGLVSDRLRRDAILIELNPQYAAMAQRRIQKDAGMLGTIEMETSA